MPSTLRTLALSAWLVTLSSGCALHQSYDPALPAERTSWGSRPLASVPPPDMSPVPHVQGVGLNHAIFASEEVIVSPLGVKDGHKCPCNSELTP